MKSCWMMYLITRGECAFQQKGNRMPTAKKKTRKNGGNARNFEFCLSKFTRVRKYAKSGEEKQSVM